MRRQTTQIICDICDKEISEVASTSMYTPTYISELKIKDSGYGKSYDDICVHCSESIISCVMGMEP